MSEMIERVAKAIAAATYHGKAPPWEDERPLAQEHMRKLARTAVNATADWLLHDDPIRADRPEQRVFVQGWKSAGEAIREQAGTIAT